MLERNPRHQRKEDKMAITTQRIQVVLEYIQKGLAKTKEGYKNFNQGMAVTTGRMKELQTSQGRWNKRMKESRTRAGRMSLGLRKATHGLRGFRMEMLGVMFFGMMLNRTFGGLVRTSMEWVGVNEIMTASLGILFLPVAEWVLEWAIKFLDWVSNLTESQKKWIGSLVILGAALGGALFILGTFSLGIGSLILVLGALTTPLALVIAAFGIIAGFFILKDYFKGIGNAAEQADAKLTGFGITGVSITSMLEGMKEKLPAVKEFFIGIKDKIGDWVGEILPKFIETGGELIMSLIIGIKNNAFRIGETIGKLITKIAIWSTENLDEVVEAAGIILDSFVQGLMDNMDKIETVVMEISEKLGDFVAQNIGKFIEIGLNIAAAIFLGFVTGVGNWIYEEITGKKATITPGTFLAETTPKIPSFQTGGIVPGRLGASVPIIAHAGERITPVGRAGSAPTIIINAEYNVTVSDKREFESMLRENNIKLAEDVRRIVKI